MRRAASPAIADMRWFMLILMQEATMLIMLALLTLGPCLDAPVMPAPQQSETPAPPRPDQPFPRPPQSCNPPAPPTS
ncbi:MAG: hypothetical protein ING09_09595 [Roseomonas sp.]|jgi:hypothetical protein|nr:hypothetical protein [Roseomonas sp.]